MLQLEANDLWIETAPKNPGIATYLDFQGLRISLSSVGQMQITEIDNGNVVWTDGWTNQVCNTTMNCKLIFQINGNLVIYYDSKPTGQPWSTYTNNIGASAVLFSTSPPYIQIVNKTCSVLYYATKLGTPRTTPLRGPTKNVTVTDKAIFANKWKSIFGVNTRISHGWSSLMVQNLTAYLGVGSIRDGALPTNKSLPDFIKMKNAGTTVNFGLVGSVTPTKSALAIKIQNISTFARANPGIITSIEGFNEINNFGFTYNGVTNFASNYSGMFQAQRDLYSLVKADTYLKNLPVFDFSGSCYGNGGSLGCQNYTGRADLGNVHNYPFEGAQPARNFDVSNDLSSTINGNYPTWKSASNYVITEFGYHSSNFTPAGLGEGVTFEAQSILILNYYLAGLKLGINKLYQYELIDEVWAGYDGAESHWGFFYNNRTAKPIGRVVHFLSQILADTSGKTGTLKYSFTNLPVTADFLLFQKSNSQYVIVIWNKAPVYDYFDNEDIVRPSTQVLFSLPSTTTTKLFKVFDIFDPNASDALPLSPISSSSVKGSVGISFSLANRAVVITVG